MNYKNLFDSLKKEELLDTSSKIRVGFERETLRINNSSISRSPHPTELGSACCNKFITIDFCESQLELITPPLLGSSPALKKLSDIHHFVTHKIGNESIWPFSMPPKINSEDDIPIGTFGTSHEGIFKHIYRVGLSNRYGRGMQSISGFHYNYSHPNILWDILSDFTHVNKSQIRSLVYFNILRNIHKMNWLLIYLFGSSPVIGNKILSNNNDSFEKLDQETSYLPYATSLRMSEYGYSNVNRKNISVSLSTLDDYVDDLRRATMTEEPRYLEYEDKRYSQLNTNILQIEAEYYAVARAKSEKFNFIRPSANLKYGGVDFLELRSIDINPFSRIGIDNETALFLEIFMLFCTVNECELFDKEAMQDINDNDLTIAKYGRKPNISLKKDNGTILMKNWAMDILDQMLSIAEQLDTGDSKYTSVICKMKSKVKNQEKTQSAKILDKLLGENISHTELGVVIAEENKDYFLTSAIKLNKSWDDLEAETKASIFKQNNLEKETLGSNEDFDQFKKRYFIEE
jgi:glutamate--cysteine ligase